MKQHFSEADLLETYYTQPGESMPVMMHLARCSACAARYERLERKLREAASCETQKPDTFWTRQRLSITRRIDEHRRASRSIARTLRLAAAVSLAFFLGGAVVYKSVEPQLEQAPPVVVTTHDAQKVERHDELLLSNSRDAWQSEELKDLHPIVDWEKW